MNTPLNFEALHDTCLKILNENTLMSLATADSSRVRTRVVDYTNRGLHVGFITWRHTRKMDDILKHPQVSLCVNILQIEGTAKVLGSPHLPEHKLFMESYRGRHAIPYYNFMSMDNVSLVMIEPTLAIVLTYEDGYLYSDHLDIINHRAFRKPLSPWNREMS